jgi:hypothetical protein
VQVALHPYIKINDSKASAMLHFKVGTGFKTSDYFLLQDVYDFLFLVYSFHCSKYHFFL